MGSCLSKKNEQATGLNAPVPAKKPEAVTVLGPPPGQKKSGCDVIVKVEKEEVKKQQQAEEGEGPPSKREIFVIKHRRSHERERDVSPLGSSGSNNGSVPAGEACSSGGAVVRTSSCTKEEVDAILIQCGRLSRSNSSGKVGASGSRKYSGSKRSYDFDQNDQSLEAGGSAGEYGGVKDDDGGDEDDGGETRRDRSRHRQSSRQQRSGSSQGRRRTPSRERDQRSGSRERGTSGNGRRVSRSPGRRSESNSNTNVCNGTSSTNRPGKLVSVPATVSSLAMDKSTNGIETTTIKRISVKRNVGENAAAGTTRSAASPRSISPARGNARAANESNNQQQPSLSRNSSRKAEHSPYRRNPLAEIDTNSLIYPQAVGNKANPANTNHVNSCNKGLLQKPTTETNNRVITKEGNSKGNNIGSLDNKAKIAKEQQHVEEAAPANVSIPPADESSRPQVVTRSRSARRSRELDINPEALLNHPPSYTTLLLEDIQNFHQKNVPVPAFSLPSCLSKACSILEAVADLNSSTTSSNLPCTLSEDRRSAAVIGTNLVGKKLSEIKDPFVESEIQGSDDLMEPSFHKYVTMRRGGTLPVEDTEEQESSGSNSIVGGGSSQQQWANSSSSWEPNSADSTDHWTSRSNTTREESERRNPAGSQRGDRTESASCLEEKRRGFSGQRTGIGRGRVGGVGKNLQQVPMAAAAAST